MREVISIEETETIPMVQADCKNRIIIKEVMSKSYRLRRSPPWAQNFRGKKRCNQPLRQL